jgi:NAD(P)-dependent dehydrogenase (short-subunit alcohol dehydrogenase family)
MLFSGKNIIVTGATGDLGTAITQRLIAQGANVLAVASDEAGLARLITEVSGPGALQTFVADVSDSEQVLGYATRAFELWGKVDGFVNNAGIQTPVRPIVEFPEEDFDRVMGVNIRGVFLGMKYVLPRMRHGGSVVAETVPLGRHGTPEDVAGMVAFLLSDLRLCHRNDPLCRWRLHNRLAGNPAKYETDCQNGGVCGPSSNPSSDPSARISWSGLNAGAI